MATFTSIVNGVLRSSNASGLPSIYDQTIAVASTITTGTAVTLPASQTYTSSELTVELNTVVLEPGVDFNYVGTGARTQITLTFDLINGDRLRFQIMRNF
jgi:hypothetical protein